LLNKSRAADNVIKALSVWQPCGLGVLSFGDDRFNGFLVGGGVALFGPAGGDLSGVVAMAPVWCKT